VREKQAIRKIENGGRQAITQYEVQRLFSKAPPEALHASSFANDRKYPVPPDRFALVKLTPKTGRTHQLRVHMSVSGYPIVGDTMYGGRTFRSDNFSFERQALHAYEISFIHPGTLERMTLQAPLAPDLRELMERLGPGEKP
jgi:23S rRNA-/tRNA-specific pseudouridylate synthase